MVVTVSLDALETCLLNSSEYNIHEHPGTDGLSVDAAFERLNLSRSSIIKKLAAPIRDNQAIQLTWAFYLSGVGVYRYGEKSEDDLTDVPPLLRTELNLDFWKSSEQFYVYFDELWYFLRSKNLPVPNYLIALYPTHAVALINGELNEDLFELELKRDSKEKQVQRIAKDLNEASADNYLARKESFSVISEELKGIEYQMAELEAKIITNLDDNISVIVEPKRKRKRAPSTVISAISIWWEITSGGRPASELLSLLKGSIDSMVHSRIFGGGFIEVVEADSESITFIDHWTKNSDRSEICLTNNEFSSKHSLVKRRLKQSSYSLKFLEDIAETAEIIARETNAETFFDKALE